MSALDKAAETVTVEQFAVEYVNHYRTDGKVITLGNYDAEMDTTDIVRDLRQQGYEPYLLKRTVTRTYSPWVRTESDPPGERRCAQ